MSSLRVRKNEKIVSSDVESLFTSVPVMETIDLILERSYHHPSLPPPSIEKDLMRELLLICTTETPFNFDDKVYIQKDGVSMGSPLGPTFADYYMASMENTLLSQNRESNPKYYKRYVDDILAVFSKASHVNWFKTRMKRLTILNFTHEEFNEK